MKKNKQKPKISSLLPAFEMASSFGFAIALPIISGVLIGYFLDNKLGTKPFFTLGLLIFGLVASFYTLLKTVKKYLNQNV